jgi:DNA-directed RNA polymerase specialized sigma24 family protein
MQDPNIIGRLRKGDGGALKSLFRSSADRAHTLAQRMTGDAEIAGKVVQAVFEELWHKRRDVDPMQDVASRILRETYVCVRALQKEKNLPICGVPKSSNPELQALIGRLGSIGDMERLVYLLLTTDGFSKREVSRALDVSDEATTTLHAKALQALHEETVSEAIN